MNFAMPLTKLDVQKGAYDRLGAQLEADGINFALFSGAAERVELCLFSEDGTTEIARVGLPEYTNEVWHGFVPGLSRGQLYGYRVHGRYAPEEGLRFRTNFCSIPTRGRIKARSSGIPRCTATTSRPRRIKIS